MILKKILCIIFIASELIFMACQAASRAPLPIESDESAPAEFPAVISSSNAAAYYYFFLAQMKIKSGDISEAKWYLEKAVQLDRSSVAIKMELARLNLMSKDADAALAIVQQVLADQPNHSEALTMAGRIYQQKKMYAEAKSLYEKALAGNTSDPNIFLYLGRIYWNERDLANAERIFRLMVNAFPTSYVAHFFNGKVLADQGKSDEAVHAFKRSLELEPSLEEARFELIRIYQKQNMSDEIATVYKSILDYNPDNIKASFELAVHFRTVKDEKRGLPLLVDLGWRSLNDNAILTFVYENYLETKQYETAAWLLEGLLKGAPQSSEIHYLAGITYDGLKRVDKALAHLERVQAESRFYANAVVHRAVLLHDMGKVDLAIEIVTQALEADPDNPDYYLYIGSFYEELERYNEAIEILGKGLEIDPKSARIHFRLGVIYDKIGDRKSAVEVMEKVVQIEPNDAKALNYLGYSYAEMGIHLEKAEALIIRALEIKPEDGYIIDSLAWVYYKQGAFEKALSWLKKAITLVPDDPTILEHIGDVYLKLNRKTAALKYYQRSLKIKAKDREALQEKIRSLNAMP